MIFSLVGCKIKIGGCKCSFARLLSIFDRKHFEVGGSRGFEVDTLHRKGV